jgi:hypothetical protein
MWDEAVSYTKHIIIITESLFSWQTASSASWPLRQVLYPSSKVKRTNTPATTWQSKNTN